MSSDRQKIPTFIWLLVALLVLATAVGLLTILHDTPIPGRNATPTPTPSPTAMLRMPKGSPIPLRPPVKKERGQ